MTTASADTETEGTEERIAFPHFLWIWNALNNTGTPAHHRRIARWLDRRRSEGETRLLLMCFRGAGKSTVVGLYCAWLLACDPTLRLIVLSAETTLEIFAFMAAADESKRRGGAPVTLQEMMDQARKGK